MSERPFREAHMDALAAMRDLDADRSVETMRAAWPSLTVRQQVGIAAGGFHGQLMKGGSQFWIHNEYAEIYQDHLQPLLREIGTPATLQVAEMVDAIWGIRVESERLEDALMALEARGLDPEDPESPPEVRAPFEALEAVAERCEAIDEAFETLAAQYADDLDHFIRSLSE